ncbi:MAG: hypothetical protein CMF59_17835 [Leptospiraceae bacterium]|nr:hypothetical protein [Leptospiraceae bacterium]
MFLLVGMQLFGGIMLRKHVFSEYLVEKGLVDRNEMARAIAASYEISADMGLRQQLNQILSSDDQERLSAKMDAGLSPAQAAASMGVVNESILNELRGNLDVQKVPLSEALIKIGIADRSTIDAWLEEFNRQRIDKDEIATFLSNTPLFKNLSASDLNEIASDLEYRYYRPGETVYGFGTNVEHVYFVQDGLLQLSIESRKRQYELYRLQAGDYFGMYATLSGMPSVEKCSAILDSYLWTLPAAKFDSLLERIPSLAITAARHVSMNLQSSLSGLQNETNRVQTSNIHCIMVPEPALMEKVGATLEKTLLEQSAGDCLLVTANGKPRNAADLEFNPQATIHKESGKTIYRLDLPGYENQFSVEAFALWIRTESKKYSSVVILFSSGSTPFRSHLLGISRRSITFVRDSMPEFLPHLKSGRDLLYLVEKGSSGATLFKNLYQSAPETLAPRSIQEDSFDEEFQNAIRRLIGVTLGIALGGGGARGSAHIGILRVLEQAGLKFDAVSGTSAGASIAAAVAMGKSSTEIQTFFEKNLFGGGHPFSDYTLPIRSLSKGKKVRKIFQKYFGDMPVRHTKIPFFPVTTNMMNGQEVALKDCDMWKAVFASGAAPGLLPLVRINEDWYGDGGLVNNVPASQLKAFGIDIVISVNISVDPARTPFSTNYKIGNAIQRSMVILMDQSVSRHLDFTDVEICPPVEDYRVTDFASGPAIMEIGIQAAQQALPRLQLLLKQRNWKP